MINHKLISFSAVQIYDISYIHLHINLFSITEKLRISVFLEPSTSNTSTREMLWWRRYLFVSGSEAAVFNNNEENKVLKLEYFRTFDSLAWASFFR